MNFCVEGQDKSTTIKEFKVVEDTIIIIFLDESVQELPNTEENRRKTIDLMLKQARLRDALIDHSSMKKHAVATDALCGFLAAFGVGMGACSAYLLVNDCGLLIDYLAVIMALSTPGAFATAVDIKKEKSMEPTELEKYREYLDAAAKGKINIYNPDFNINTLDGLSKRKTKKLIENNNR